MITLKITMNQEFVYIELESLIYPMQSICTYGRINSVRKSSSNMCFVILRSRQTTLQCVCLKKEIGADAFAELLSLPVETLVLFKGCLAALPESQPTIKSCTYDSFEFNVKDMQVIDAPVERLPFQISDANTLYNDDTDRCAVLLPTRLDNRYFELRTPVNNVIFKLKNNVTKSFLKCTHENNFIGVNTPKLIGTSSESGASVFKLNYFNKVGYLAQSPQLYKQMLINADFKKVCEVGPVFRAEKSFSNRHLCEFIGLDMEIELTPPFNYLEIIRTLWNTLHYIYMDIYQTCDAEISYLKTHHNFDDLVIPNEPLIFNFREGAKMLNDKGYEQCETDDLSTENESRLGKIIKEEYGADLFVLTEYPTSVRPFYTMRIPGTEYTKSYDIIMRGQEICSGAQRENNYSKLTSQIKELGLDTEPFNDYLNSFKYGSPPHGGGGFGLERIVMLMFDLKNIRNVSLFPRDPNRLNP
jgi:aspartyl-tRNA synthetase